jgi:hypothetical protein
MPPRKRAVAAPTADPTLSPDTDPSVTPDPGQGDASTSELSATPERQADADADQSPQGDGDGGDSAPSEDKEPADGDLRQVPQPCGECFPDGWGDGVFARGCEHGTWVRDNQD